MVKVLIVDDTSFMRATLRLMLSRSGFEVVGEAENGQVAIDKFKELQPDIVTMDITMPLMDGIIATREIKSIDSKAKIVMISALGQEAKVAEAIAAGAANFIVKPYKEEHVVKTLNKVAGVS